MTILLSVAIKFLPASELMLSVLRNGSTKHLFKVSPMVALRARHHIRLLSGRYI